MAKIPFDIKYRPQIESGEYRVETESGTPAKIIDWEWNNEHTGVCLAVKITEKGKDTGYLYTEYGKRAGLFPYEKDSDLFIVTPEPTDTSEFEMKVSEFAEAYERAATDYESEEYKTCNGNLQLIIDKYAAELLALAREELLANDTVLKEYAQVSREQGKAEALKDLPRWKPAAGAYDGDRLPRIDWLLKRLVAKFEEGIFYLDMNDLYKLPRFKEKS